MPSSFPIHLLSKYFSQLHQNEGFATADMMEIL